LFEGRLGFGGSLTQRHAGYAGMSVRGHAEGVVEAAERRPSTNATRVNRRANVTVVIRVEPPLARGA
jgi:hypothetical protein